MKSWVFAAMTAALLGAQLAEEVPKGFASRTPRYRIQPSDVMEISFRFTPEFNQKATVQPDGFIALYSAGELKVTGLTVKEATDAIVQRYAGILHAPEVTVVLTDFEKPFFVVGGEVVKPGRFDLRGEITLTSAVAMAGGFNFGARDSEVLVFRRISKDTFETKKVNVKDILTKGQLDEDVSLQSGDAVYVSKSKLGKVDQFMRVSRLGLYFNPLFWTTR